jgi:hypothetical protein
VTVPGAARPGGPGHSGGTGPPLLGRVGPCCGSSHDSDAAAAIARKCSVFKSDSESGPAQRLSLSPPRGGPTPPGNVISQISEWGQVSGHGAGYAAIPFLKTFKNKNLTSGWSHSVTDHTVIMTEFVQDLAAFEIHHHRIQPYGGLSKESIKASSSGFRTAYNLYIGSIMNREACFSISIQEDEQDLCIHSIREDAEYGSETELFIPSKDLCRS